MGTIMANYITIFLFVGGAVGWTLFALAFVQLQHSRRKELEMIKEISKELKTVKEEIKLLTTGTIK
jgi:uncharacterized membrane protein YciS (DUF1049 family)